MSWQNMYLKCRSCGGCIEIAKRQLGEFWATASQNQLNRFFEVHRFGDCGLDGEGMDGYVICYGSEVDWRTTT